MNILIIEDDESVGELERDYLEMSGGFHCTLCNDGVLGLQQALSGDWSLVIIDVMLPGLSGFEICRRLREERDVPVIIISALAERRPSYTVMAMGKKVISTVTSTLLQMP